MIDPKIAEAFAWLAGYFAEAGGCGGRRLYRLEAMMRWKQYEPTPGARAARKQKRRGK